MKNYTLNDKGLLDLAKQLAFLIKPGNGCVFDPLNWVEDAQQAVNEAQNPDAWVEIPGRWTGLGNPTHITPDATWFDEVSLPDESDSEVSDEADPGDMDGDAATALASAGFGTDEDYGMYDGGIDW